MIILSSSLINTPIMGLQTGSELGKTTRAIINPANLAVIAYDANSPLLGEPDNDSYVIRIADIRELSDLGFIVDSIDEFIQPKDVIKLYDIYQLDFNLLGMHVVDEKRNKLGKVIDYTLETASFIVQQLTVKRPLLKSLNDTELLIHRSQIIEINNDSIVVHSQAKAPEKELHEVVGSYVNPFRKTKTTAPETISSDNND